MSMIDERNRAILTETHKQKHSVFLSGDNLAITFQTFIIGVEKDHLVLENRIKPRYINQFASSAKFAMLARMVRFQADRITSDGQYILFPLTKDSVIEETRQAERFSFSADERVVTEILNPYDGETRLSKTVMDMSATGLSLRTTYDSKLFKSDTYLPSIRVIIDGEPYIQGPGRVVYSRKLIDLQGQLRTQVGIKFEAS